MNVRDVRLLAQILEKSGLTRMEICEGDIKICLERSPGSAQAPQMPICDAALVYATPDPVASLNPEDLKAVDFNRVKEVASPMVGVFYAASSPEADPFVKRGDKVKKGDVLCIIEAMKMLNEITAESDGEIADICVHNGQVVEFGQTMFKLF